ncbi:GNAT family N-acetyltransferase [Vibrio sp. FNV 38]|nr:GNAT family N-acetyltransferase [Vibrio sp. FNV 38]
MLEIREITAQQDSEIHDIITTVGKEFGAIGDGFGPSDTEVLAMSQHYKIESRACYWVALHNGVVIGGAGIAALNDQGVCELRKLFLSANARGLGVGRALLAQCLQFAEEMGYSACYLDTLASMTSAIALYEKFGFEHLSHPLEETEHEGCDVWMLKIL